MISETSRAGFPAGRGGVFTHLLAVANALARFVEARLELFTKESKAALAQLLALAGAIIAALLLFALGYMFLLAAAIALIANASEISWVWITLIVAGVHFILAVVCLLVARAMATRAPFPETAAELKKDREWLKNLDGTTRPTN